MMNNNIQYFTEGAGDKALLTTLEIHQKNVSHNSGSSGIARAMKNQLKNFHKVIIGVTDNDNGKNYPDYFNEFTEIASPDNFVIKHKQGTNQYLIFLCCPALEKWILDSAKSVNVVPEDFNLSSDINKFKKVVKKLKLVKNENYQKFIQAIKHSKAESFELLREALNKPEKYRK